MPIFSISLVLVSAAMNAGWNMIARKQGASDMFLRLSLVIAAIGVGPLIAAEFFGTPILAVSWKYALASSVFLAFNYLALSRAYASGDFTLVYPAARGIPALMVAAGDVLRGHPPAPLGWLGMALVTVGCLLLPHPSWRHIQWSRYRNRTTAWIIVAALTIVGFTVADSQAAHAYPPGLATAMQYNVLETTLSIFTFGAVILFLDRPLLRSIDWSAWKWPLIASIFAFGGYTLVLWAYQLSAQASYVIAVRQISIVIGVVAGTFFFREPAGRSRIGAAAIITLGVVCIALAR